MDNVQMDLQKLNYFTEGNTFTGSRTKDWARGVILRYLVRPDLDEGKLLAYSWDKDVCFEKAEEKQEAEFPLDEQGLEGVRSWLLERYGQL